MLICFWTAYNSWFYWTVISFSHSKDGCSQELLNLDKLSNLKHMALYSAVAYEAIKRVVCWSMTAAHCVVVYVDVLEGNQNKNNCLMSKFFCCRNCSKGSCSYFDLPLSFLQFWPYFFTQSMVYFSNLIGQFFFPEFHPVSGFPPFFSGFSSNLQISSVLTIFLNKTDVYFSNMIW